MDKGIVIDAVSFHYPNKPEALTNISLSVSPGTFLGITGVNGSGKSTITYLLNGLIPHAIAGVLTGTVTVGGVSTRKKSVAYFARSIGMVFQNPDFSLFNLTVAEEVAFGLKNLKQPVDQKHIRTILTRVGLEGFENRDPQSLSFGEKQKVCLASVLALDVSYIVLDEPTAMLDYASSIGLYELLKELCGEGKTIITVEHDTDFLWDYTDKMIVLDRGRIKADGKTSEVLGKTKLLTSLGIKRPHGGMR
jgi:energy-coupling factor transporter ATP-binding protein EcfA2